MARAAVRLARAAAAVSKARDGVVLRALRAEIDHELSSGPPQPPRAPMVRGFAVEWDDAKSRDVVLTKSRGEGEEEEVAVSALLGPVVQEGERVMPGKVFAKVCVGKARGEANGSILQFDCEVRERGGRGSDLVVHRVSHVFSSGDGPLRPPLPRHPKGKLQEAFREYLAARGIDTELTDHLIQHLREKERQQYATWLQTLEAAISLEA